MVDPEKQFSIGSLDVGHLAINVRYRRRCYDYASFRTAKPKQQPLSLPSQQQRQHHNATENISCMTTTTGPRLTSQDTPETRQESGPNRSSTSPTESRSTSAADTPPTGGLAARSNEDGEDEKYFDGTGLLVWPGSRLLASFLVDPLGARRLFPRALDSLSSSCCERDSTTRGFRCIPVDASLITVGGHKGSFSKAATPTTTTTTTTRGHCARCDEQMTTSLNDGNTNTCVACCGETKLLSANIDVKATTTAIRHAKPSPAEDVIHEGGCCAQTGTKATHAAVQKDSGCGMAGPERTVRRPASPAILELGAGTGVCGIAASLALGCSVIVTDRRNDVLANLRENIKLNGLGQRAQVIRLAWGGALCETRELPAEIMEKSPFKVRGSSCKQVAELPFGRKNRE